ncbi:general secretion pathway protein GspJ [Geomonas sp. Red276]
MLNSKGFTLIELLVALALMVILSGALYGTYFSVTAARERGGARIEARRELSSTLGRLHNEIASAYFPATGANTAGKALFKVEDRDVFGKPASLIAFTFFAPPRVDTAPGSGLTRVSYFVREKDGVLTLVRESRDPYFDTTVKSYPYPVIDQVESFLVECYDGGKWVKTWDTAPGFNLGIPNAVRITVTTKGGGTFTTIASPGMKRGAP